LTGYLAVAFRAYYSKVFSVSPLKLRRTSNIAQWIQLVFCQDKCAAFAILQMKIFH